MPAQGDARFVSAMEDVLEVYARPFDPQRPVVCVDEAMKQLLGEKFAPQEATTEHIARYDTQYVRNGTSALFMLFEPLAAKRCVLVRERRTGVDYAHVMRFVCDEMHPHAKKIVVVQDNLNTHGPHSLYQAFPPAEARRLSERIEWHFTPRHASWLNMAEIELSVLARQCLEERMENLAHLKSQVEAWQERRNQTASRVNWHFTTKDARIKLRRLYPELLPG